MAYQYWQHRTSGDVFAVEIEDGTEDTVVSAFGPVYHGDRTVANLPDFDFNHEDGDFVAAMLDEWQAADPSDVIHVTLDGTRY